MKTKNPKLVFIQSIAEQAKRLDHQISSEAKSAIKGLQQRPKTYYTLQDVEELVESLKNKMLSINKEAHTEFSKKGLKGVPSLDISETETEPTLVDEEELNKLKEQNQELQDKLKNMKELEMKIDDYKILLEDKNAEIDQIKSQTGITSEKIQEQMEDLNKLQELLDEVQRESKQAKQDREKIETEFETVGNALMSTRLEVEELQTALGNKDIEIENLKSEIQILSGYTEENIKLKEKNKELADKSEIYENESKKLNIIIKEHESTINSLNVQISKLEQENEDLLLDSGETSQKAVLIQQKLEDLTDSYNQKESEIKELTDRFSTEITGLKKELSVKAAETHNYKNKIENSQENIEELQKTKQSLETQIENLYIELKSKETRIESLETDRNELREQFSVLKIEHEKQKSDVTDLKTQLMTKNRELEEMDKEIEALRQQQEAIVQDASDSRGTIAEIERQKDLNEIKIRNLKIQLNELADSKERLENKFNIANNELETVRNEKDKLTNKKKELEEKMEKLRSTVETLRINLAKNPKYAILFVLQDIRQANVGELAKTVAIQLVFTVRLMKELESEGWVHFDEDTGIVKLIKPFLDIE